MTTVIVARRGVLALCLALACAAAAYSVASSVVGARASGLELELVRPPFAQSVDCQVVPEASGGMVPCA